MKEAIHTKSNNKLLYIIYSIITILLFSLIIHSTSTHANSIEFSATVEPSLNVTIPANLVSLNLNPANSAFSSQDLTVSVGTNNTTGYTLTMTASSTDLTRTEAISGTYPTISTLASETAESSFTPNKWGYRFSDNTANTNYQPFTTNIPFNESSTAVNNDTRTITFGAKVNADQAPGTYELTLSFTAVAKAPMPHIQNYDPALCTSAPSLVYDVRDGNAYTIARLADGKCWMTTNLNLAGGTRLESTNSDVPDGYTLYNPYYTLPASATKNPGDAKLTDGTQFSSDSGEYVFNTGNITTNQSNCTSSSPCNSYYSWLAATAGGKDSSGNAVTSNGYNATYSICPKGWRLPTSTTSNGDATASNRWKTGDYYALATAYGANLESQYYQSSATFYNNAGPGTTPNFLLAGYYNSGSFYDGGGGGYYWSATSHSSIVGYSLSFNSGYVSSADDNYRRYGLSVRCVLDETTTMQGATSASLAVAMPNDGDSTILRDARDGNTYTVRRITDKNGSTNYWMVDNLRFVGTSLSSSTSNVATTYTDTSPYLINSNVGTSPAAWKSLADDSVCKGTELDSDNSTYQCMQSGTDNNGNPTVWYNYAGATAGTITGISNSAEATYDICPKGWHLPTSAEIDGFDGTNSGDATYAASAQFAPVYGGRYYNGGLYVASTYGNWWSATAHDTALRYSLDYLGGKLYSGNGIYYYRHCGFSVRCLRSS